MPHIHTNPGEHDPTASLWIVRRDTEDGEPAIMLHRHKKLGRYMQFGGHIELHESPWATIAHEGVEEVGYELDQLKVIQYKNRMPFYSDKETGLQAHPVPFYDVSHDFFDIGDNHFHDDRGWMFVADEPPRRSPAEDESQDVRMFTAAELDALPEKEIYWNIREIGKYCIEVVRGLGEDSDFEAISTADFSTEPFRTFDQTK